jgi:hypothetical protein
VKRRFFTVLMLVVAMAAGCSSLPRSGDVHAVIPTPDSDDEIVLSAQPPAEGATPEEIVLGFLDASAAGLDDDFNVARQFLAGSAASDWDPLAQVRVYPDSQNPQRTRTDDGGIRVSVGSLGTLDSNGIFTESAGDATITADFSLAKNADGEWRIVSLQDGIFLSEHLFDSLYTAAPLYFLSADSNALVADLRWYPRKTFPTLAVQGLLSGPSTWLENGVGTAVPEGTSLNDSVTVKDDVAMVDLSSEALSATGEQRALLVAQLRRTLTSFSSIKSVKVTVEGSAMDVSSVPDLATYPYGSYALTVISDGVIATVADKTATAVMDDPEIAKLGLIDVAVGYQDKASTYAALADNGSQLFWMSASQKTWKIIGTGDALVHPSFDSFGWVFTGEAANDGQLIAYPPDGGEPVELSVPWMKGAKLRDIAISREASRIVVVLDVGGDVVADVAAITRTSDGIPSAIGDPVRIGQRLSDITDIAWISSTTLAALGKSGAGSDQGLYTLMVGGPMDSLGTPYSGTIAITAGRDEESIAGLTDLGVAVGLTGQAWTSLVEGVSAIAYPG